MKKIVMLLALALVAAPAFAGDSGILKLSLWGKKLAVALPNHTQNVTGVELGIGSDTESLKGVQLDFVYSKADDLVGVQSALLGKASHVTGVQWSFINLSDGLVSGVQAGLYNQAEELHGLQFGLVNNVKTIHGLQIGLVNLAGNGWFPVMVIVNGRF